ncbi:hypothetical protein Sste5346_001518 [Sporothrix stenoceras]|uniref:Multicopper oxidase n=1 Tax=Sporothrix stenoceras TaxID=5173 RepID=A0ABR3ZP13_9PEZI
MHLLHRASTALVWAVPWLAVTATGSPTPSLSAEVNIDVTTSGAPRLLTPGNGCRVRSFDLTITWEKHAPDGYAPARDMALINGQYPGPTLEVDEGDVVEVMVHNLMPQNTTVHFHGIEMEGTNWSDGVPGLTQRQIQTGNSFLYQWKATQYGSYWYHAHERGQLDDGLFGAIVIRPAPGRAKPFSLISNDSSDVSAMEAAEAASRPLVLSDFRHVTSAEGWAIELAAGIETPCYDALLINGQGRVDCWSEAKRAALLTPPQAQILALGNETSLTAKGCLSANIIGNVLAAGIPNNLSAVPPAIFDVCTPTNHSLARIEVDRNTPDCTTEGGTTWAAFDVIGTFGLMTAVFSVDGHPLWIYAVDGSYVEPMLVDAIEVTNGDRYSVMVPITENGNYTIRVASDTTAQSIAGFATLVVGGGRSPASSALPSSPPPAYINDVGVNTTAGVVFFDQADMKSFPPDVGVGNATVDRTFTLGIRIAGASYNWALNHSVYPMQLDNEEPLLFQPHPDIDNNVTITTLTGEWIDLVVQALSFPMPPHPIHKHGNKMWQVGSGSGIFNYSSVAEAVQHIPDSFNLVAPPKRDTLATPPATTGPAWMVVRYQVTNPGAWFLHCHIQSHLLGGMAMAIQDGVDQWPEVPEYYKEYV